MFYVQRRFRRLWKSFRYEGERDSGPYRKVFGFVTGTAFTLPPESRSPSYRNAVRLPTGITFGFDRIPHLPEEPRFFAGLWAPPTSRCPAESTDGRDCSKETYFTVLGVHTHRVTLLFMTRNHRSSRGRAFDDTALCPPIKVAGFTNQAGQLGKRKPVGWNGEHRFLIALPE